MTENVTDRVDFGNPEDEHLPLNRCMCGMTFEPFQALVSIYSELAWKCPSCGVRLVFTSTVRVLRVLE